MRQLSARIVPSSPLRLLPSDPGRAVLAGTIAALTVSAFCVLLDAAIVPQSPLTSLWPHTALMLLEALGEELKYRLLMMTAFVSLPMAFNRRPSPHWIITAIILSQFAKVWPLVLAAPFYASLRYWLVGCVWGWLYWKHGWVTATTAHVACHLILDPLLLLTSYGAGG